MVEEWLGEDDLIDSDFNFEEGYFDRCFEDIFADQLMVMNRANECIIPKSISCHKIPLEAIASESIEIMESFT